MAFEKNKPRSIYFEMEDTSGVRQAGKTGIAGTISKDGAADAAVAGAITEIGAGRYVFTGTAADWNCDAFSLRFAVTGCRDTILDGNTEGDYTAMRAALISTALPNVAPGAAGGLAVVGSAMTLTPGERTATANEVEAQIIDDTDSERVLSAMTDKIASVNPSLGGLTLNAIASSVWGAATRSLTDKTGFAPTAGQNASQVRTELGVELGRIDTNINSRSSHSALDVWLVSLGAAFLPNTLGKKLKDWVLDVNGCALVSATTAVYTYPVDFSDSALDVLGSQTGEILNAIGTRATPGDLPADYQQRGVSVTLPAGLATSQNVSDAQGVITTAIATRQAQGAVTLTPAERNAVADALLDRADGAEAGLTLRGWLAAMWSSALGLGGPIPGGTAYRNRANTKARVTMVHDAQGNRTAVVIDLT